MSGVVLPFPLPPRPYTGTVHVMGDAVARYEVAHESSSGNSWGSFTGPFRHGQDAIAAAFALNRDVYSGGCDVAICEPALRERDQTHFNDQQEGF
jgi:hypothetical protein